MKKIVNTKEAPAAIGPYSQAVIAGKYMFTSGQIPLRPDGTLVEGGIEEQTRQVFANLKAIIEKEGASLHQVVKTTVFLKDLSLFGDFNKIYGEYFVENQPARSTVEVARLPREALVEIEVVVLLEK